MNLEVGTIKTNVEAEKEIRRQSRTGGGKNGGGGGKNRGGGGNDNGDDEANKTNFEPSRESAPNKLRIGMWFVLLVVMMTFGTLISAYIVISTNGVMEWKPFNLPIQVWVSSFLILASSVTLSVSQRLLNAGNQKRAKNWLTATAALGGIFISSQALAWVELVRRGIYVASNPYAGFFYLLTVVHALHVLGGITVLGYILLRTWRPTPAPEELAFRQTVAGIVGWYWHFMGGLWIVLFLLLGFWK